MTITNVGRLPDAYQIVPEPPGAAKIAEPNLARLAPRMSVDVEVTIKQTPLSPRGEEHRRGGRAQPVGQLTIE